ncbi:Uncharacterized protein QTN25_005511 [Entamoeba marina]
MVVFIIHHTLESILLSQFYKMNIQARKLEALMEVLNAHIKSDNEREGACAPDSQRFQTFTIESQEYSTSSLKSLQEEFEGIQVIYCEVGGIIISIGLSEYESVFVAQQFIVNWVTSLRRNFKTNLLNNIYDRLDEVLVHLDKYLPMGNLLLTNPSYSEYLKSEATSLTRAM